MAFALYDKVLLKSNEEIVDIMLPVTLYQFEPVHLTGWTLTTGCAQIVRGQFLSCDEELPQGGGSGGSYVWG